MVSQISAPRNSLTARDVESQVARFWRFLTDKNYQGIHDFYSADALVFGTATDRAESALTTASRRNIEYFGEHMKLEANVGAIAVSMLNERSAIAGYTFTFSATERHPSGSTRAYEVIHKGRATQVFAMDKDSNIRIVHEHFSIASRR